MELLRSGTLSVEDLAVGRGVEETLRSLSPDGREVLEQAAVAGERIPTELLEQATALGRGLASTSSWRSVKLAGVSG